MHPNRFLFWSWLLRGFGDGAGIWRIADRWLVVHIAVGIGLATIVPIGLEDAGRLVALPVSSAIVGLSLAWVGAAHALMVTTASRRLAAQRSGGIAEYAFTFQLAVLVLVATFVLWCICALGVFDRTWPTPSRASLYFAAQVAMYALTSLAMREGWQAVLGSQQLLIANHELSLPADDQPSAPSLPPVGTPENETPLAADAVR